MAGIGSDELRLMGQLASRLWGPGRRWAPGEIAWAVLTDTGEQEVRFVGEGFCWTTSDFAVIVATRPEDVLESIEWAGAKRIQVPEGDRVLTDVLKGAGYEELIDAPFELDVRLVTTETARAATPAGYIVRSARPDDDLVEVHRAAWRPADLPFAPGHAPVLSADATSAFTAEMLAAVQAAPGYEPALHIVVEVPDTSLAASCIAWFDAKTGVAAIEPLGVRATHRNRGLAGAMCLYAATLVRDRGGHGLIIHPRGDTAYPAPRRAYLRVGFVPVGRTSLYGPP